jgi:preprotein translocase subunit SecY
VGSSRASVRGRRRRPVSAAHPERITLPGSLFLATVAVLPSIMAIYFHLNIGFSGVSILIVTGVALETMKQIESQLMMRN